MFVHAKDDVEISADELLLKKTKFPFVLVIPESDDPVIEALDPSKYMKFVPVLFKFPLTYIFEICGYPPVVKMNLSPVIVFDCVTLVSCIYAFPATLMKFYPSILVLSETCTLFIDGPLLAYMKLFPDMELLPDICTLLTYAYPLAYMKLLPVTLLELYILMLLILGLDPPTFMKYCPDAE
ncbi:MAG: hypothetical protein EZS28_007855 [Streblomastix strix]|uniref:Uncharacterized protein n=1 Tax=Streblomastix strix TaxID=222440 RepID=A0A5J4WRB9_9EUKA|nr:MAG: hypothetical protein EZS28_007855 [Streblomastix strix]